MEGYLIFPVLARLWVQHNQQQEVKIHLNICKIYQGCISSKTRISTMTKKIPIVF